MSQPILIKKYGNRRLYDTSDSRYITLDELAEKIQSGSDVRVVDVNSGTDLTQVTLTQIIIEGRGAAHMLPVPLLTQLIRLGDDALAEFLGQYMSMTLEFYLRSKQNAAALAPYNPFATLPFSAADAFARLWNSSPFARGRQPESPQAVWQTPTPPTPQTPSVQPGPGAANAPTAEDVAALRSELEELKRAVQSNQNGASNRRGGRKTGGKSQSKKTGSARGRRSRKRGQED